MHNSDLAYLARHWPALTEYRLKGTPRRWHEIIAPWLPEETIANIAGSPAPVHLNTLDLILEVDRGITAWLAHAGQDVPGTFKVRIGRLDALVYRQPAGSSYATDVLAWADHVAARVQQHIDGLPDGQLLKAVCPWCYYQSLRVRTLSAVTDEPTPFIRCESGVCAPGVGEVGTWWEGLPCWPMSQWEWLAGRLDRLFEDDSETNSEKDNQQQPETNCELQGQVIHK